MDIEQFTDKKTGSLTRVSSSSGEVWAFVPDELPTDWEFSAELWPLLVDAMTALASLSSIGRYLPSAELLRLPLHWHEAQRSSNLEGTFTSPEQQILFDIGHKTETRDEDAGDLKEVSNYTDALMARERDFAGLPLSLRLIRGLHAILLRGVRGANKEPGEFRGVQVGVGSPLRYVPPPATHLEPLLQNFEQCMHISPPYHKLVWAFILHYQIEAIHPFRDGNGRVGRLLLAMLIAEWCELSGQWLFMSGFYFRNKEEYHDRLLKISTHGDWRGWIEFSLTGVIESAKDTDSRCQKLLTLREQYREQTGEAGGSIRLSQITELLFKKPVIRIPEIASFTGTSYPTAKTDVERLVSAGILVEIDLPPQRTFVARKLVDIIFA